MLPASLQQAELELLVALGSTGSSGSRRGLGPCFANLSRGGMAAQASSARQVIWSTELVRKRYGVLLCP